jgi:hypothetical protein
MLIIGCDYHPSFQQIAMLDTETGELQELRLKHREEAEQFYRALARTAGARYVWEWKPVAMQDGTSGCWQNWASSCG